MAFDSTKPEFQAQILSEPLRNNFNALKTQIDVEHNDNGTHKDQLKKSGDTATGDIGICKSVPALRLIGTELSAKDLRLVEYEGNFKIQKNLGSEVSPVWVDMLSLSSTDYLISGAKITEANLASSTQIPDSRLAQITTVGKVASSALPTELTKTNVINTFTQAQVIQGSDAGLYLDNNVDSVYKAELKKDSDTTAKLLIKNKSDGVDVAVYSFAYDGNLTTKKLTAQTQLVSQAATGTPPLVVSSSTMVNNLNAQYWNGQSVTNTFTGSTYATNYHLVANTHIQTYAGSATTFWWANGWELGRLDGWYGSSSAYVDGSSWFAANSSRTQTHVYGYSHLREYINPAIGAGSYSIMSILQALVNAAHVHAYYGAITAGVCNCNCNCLCY